MDKEEILNFYNSIKNKINEMKIMEEQVKKIDREIQLDIEQYRNKSVVRVLEYINSKFWENENIDNLQNLICHCLNKLHGNIDGIELSFKEE